MAVSGTNRPVGPGQERNLGIERQAVGDNEEEDGRQVYDELGTKHH